MPYVIVGLVLLTLAYVAAPGGLSADERAALERAGLVAQAPGAPGPHDAGSPIFDKGLEISGPRALAVLGERRYTALHARGWVFWGRPARA